MKAKEYQEKKNIIFDKYIGKTLVPEEQMEDFEVTLLMVTRLEKYIRDNSYILDDTVMNQGNCLHCATYANNANKNFWCQGCPIYENGNYCGYASSTYSKCKAATEAKGFDDTEMKKELLALAQEFVDAHQHLKPPKEEKKTCKMQS